MALPEFGHMYRLTRDPEFSVSQSGVAVCRVGLACSEKYGDKETQLFIDATAFKKTAEFLATVQKGHRVFVYGKIQTDKWQDQQGQNRSKTAMIINKFEFIEKKQDNQQASQQSYQQPQNGGFQAPPQQSGGQQPIAGGYQNSNNHQDFSNQSPPDDDIPFACNIA